MALENLPFRILEQIDKQSTLPDSVAVDLEKYGIPQKFGKFVADVAEIFKTLQTDDVENETHRLEQLAKVVYTNHKELLNSVFAEKVSIETANLYDSIKQVIKDVGIQYLLKKENAIQKLPNEVSSYVEQQLNIFFVELFHDLDKIFTVDNTNLSNRNNKSNNEKQKNKTSKSKQTEKSKQKPKEEEKQKPSTEQQKSQQPTTKQQAEANNNFISELQHQQEQEQEEPQAEQIKVVTEQNAKQLVINTLSKHAKPVTEYVKNVLYINTKRILPEKHWFQKKLFRYKHNLKQKFINSTVISNIRKHVTDIKNSHYMLIAKRSFTRIQLSIKNVLFKYVRPVLNNVWNRQMQQLFAPIVLVASGTLLLVGGILQAAYSLGRFITKIIISGFKAGIKMLWNSIKYLGGLLKKAFNVVSNLVGDMLNWIIRYPGMFFAGFFFKEICNWIKGNIVGATDLLKNNIITKFLKTTVTKVYDNIKEKYEDFKKKHPEWGKVTDFLLGTVNFSFDIIGKICTGIRDLAVNIGVYISEHIKPGEAKTIATAIKTGTVEDLKTDEQKRKAYEYLNTHSIDEINRKSGNQIAGEIAGKNALDTIEDIKKKVDNVKTAIKNGIKNAINSIKESDAYNEVERIVNGAIDFFNKHGAVIESIIKLNTLSITYPGAYAGLKSTSSFMQYMILGSLITGVALSHMFNARNDDKFLMQKQFLQYIGTDKEDELQKFELNALNAFRKNLPENLTAEQKKNEEEKYNTILVSLRTAKEISEAFENTIFAPNIFNRLNEKNVAINPTITKILNTIQIGDKQYHIFAKDDIDFINALANVKQKNSAIRALFGERNKAITRTIKAIYDIPEHGNNIIYDILNNQNYFGKYGNQDAFSNSIIPAYFEHDAIEEVKIEKQRYANFKTAIQEGSKIPLNPKQYQLPKPTDPIVTNPEQIFKLPSVNIPKIGTGNRISTLQTVTPAILQANKFLTHAYSSFNINMFGGFNEDDLRAEYNIANINNIMNFTAIKSYLYSYISQRNSPTVTNPHELPYKQAKYIIDALMEYSPELKDKLLNMSKKYNGNAFQIALGAQANGSNTLVINDVNDILAYIRNEDLFTKFLSEKCWINGRDIDLSTYLLSDNPDEAYTALTNALNIMTIGNANKILAKMGFDSKEKFISISKLYNTKITLTDIREGYLEILHKNFMSSFNDKDDYLRKISNAIGKIQELLTRSKDTNKNSITNAFTVLGAYDETVALLDEYSYELMDVIQKYEQKENENKTEEQKFIDEFRRGPIVDPTQWDRNMPSIPKNIQINQPTLLNRRW